MVSSTTTTTQYTHLRLHFRGLAQEPLRPWSLFATFKIMEFPIPNRSTSASRNKPPSRPSTPLRPSSRPSVRDSQTFTPKTGSSEFSLESLEPAFAELSDSMADLEANFMHLQLMHESLSRFNESFASFLYGMNMNAFCVDFPEVCSVSSPDRNGTEATITGSYIGLFQTCKTD